MYVSVIKPAMDFVLEAKQQLENLTPDQVLQELDKPEVLLVDLREGDELQVHGKILGSVHVPRGMLEFYADPSSPNHIGKFDPSRRIILYSASGGRSALGAVSLKKMGYADIAHLEGGFQAWKGAGKPIVQ